MSDDKFEQPIFGANYMRGTVQPMYGLIPGPAKYKFWFMNGGCSKFLKAYHYIVDKLRMEMKKPNYAPGIGSQFELGNLQEQLVAFADANDPSVLYVSQPPVASEPQPMQNYLIGQTGPTYVPGAPSSSPSYNPVIEPTYPPSTGPAYHPPSGPAYHPGPAPAYSPGAGPIYQPSPASYNPSYQPGFSPSQPSPPYQPGPHTYQPDPSHGYPTGYPQNETPQQNPYAPNPYPHYGK